MTPNRLTAIAFRWSISAVCALWMFAPNAHAQSAATAINGVYNGTYTCAIGPRTLKLSLLASGNGSLTGVFTFYLPPTSHTQAFSYSMSGTFDAASGKFRLNPVKWETPPPGGYSMVGMDGAFDPGTGQVAGKINYASCGAFQATRDQAESANSASVISPQKAAGAAQSPPSVSTTSPPQVQNTSITGVYNGGYSCARATANLKLSIIATPDGSLTGLFTLVPPPNTGDPSTYSLSGGYDWLSHQFLVTPVALGAPAPSEYSIPQLTGSYVPGSEMISGRGYNLTCDFHVIRDKTESANIASVMDAQRNLPQVPFRSSQPPAAPVSEAKSTPLAPAPKGLVRKSKAYWGAYRTDLIRQVFDGGFGYDVDTSPQFQVLFNTYVESYSKSCRAYLPARHESVTITQVTTKTDRYGNVVNQQEGQSATVEVDSRFASKYRKYGELLTSSQQSLGAAMGIMSGRVSASSYFDPGTDMIKFFGTETCQSAAMRQLSENLLRAATGERSLQQVGATIAGASAETDASAPPGRFAHFVDGCNAFYRDPANSKYAGLHSTDWCQCLSEHYRNVMTPEEESRYGNDFKRLFLDEIAQPQRNSTDPAWPRLHPARDQCAQ